MPLDLIAERYRLLVRRHADATAAVVVGALVRLTLTTFVPFAVARIVIANARANVMAQQYLTTMRYVALLGAVPLPVPSLADADSERIAKAVQIATDLGPGSVERLARSEPLRAGQRALSAAFATTGQSWTRHAGTVPARSVRPSLTGSRFPPTWPWPSPIRRAGARNVSSWRPDHE